MLEEIERGNVSGLVIFVDSPGDELPDNGGEASS